MRSVTARMVLLALAVGLPAVLYAVPQQPADRAAAGSAAAAPPAPAGVQPAAGSPVIDQILEAEEQLLSDTGYSYDAGNRRDPFKSLQIGTKLQEGQRPEGIPGLMIDEIALVGIFHTPRGWVVQVQAANKDKSYLIREGDQLFDGDVVSIAKNEVVFKQAVADPTAIKPFREVVKKLKP